MPLAAGKETFKEIMKQQMLYMSENINKDQTPEEAIDAYTEVLATAIIALIQQGQVVPTLLMAPNGPVTGTGTIV